MKINTYNRSFIGFMEQCNDGEWCKTLEAEQLLWDSEVINHNLEHKNQILKECLETEKELTAILAAGLICTVLFLFVAITLYIIQ